MSELLPIIRRVRRPLLPVEGLAGGHQADAKPVAGVQPAVPPVAPGEAQPKGKDQHGKAASSEPGE